MRHQMVEPCGTATCGMMKIDDLLIVDDHPLMCEALAISLCVAFGLRQAHCEGNLAGAIKRLKYGKLPDAILLDLNLPDAKGSEGVLALSRVEADIPITVVSANEDRTMISAVMAAGAQGYISKSLSREAMCAALRRVWSGERVTPDSYDPEDATHNAALSNVEEIAHRLTTLTRQQLRILRQICLGKSNKEISFALNISEATVKTHIAAVMSKTGAQRRTQIVLLANDIKLFKSD
ncbi:MAG: LuxR family transcriptional regulator [Rhodobacteraceae bacterium]|nr:MAG: LuxR family transcriptional regulator [Paracoccaceae bacterium]